MPSPDWQEVNAYVDGELNPAAAADLAGRFGRDSALTSQVSAAARVKAASAAALAVDPADVPAIVLGPAAARRSRLPRLVLAGSLAAAVALVAVLTVLLWPGMRQGPAAAWLTAAAARHSEWLSSDTQPEPVDNPNLVLAEAGGFDHVPDLAVAHLAVARVAFDASSEQPGLFVGYVGVNGCRLSLWIGPAPEDLPAALTENRAGSLHSFTWRVEHTGYAVVASGMDAARFEATAVYLERQTRRDAEREIRTAAARTEAAAKARCTG
jgi:hypothetical protein